MGICCGKLSYNGNNPRCLFYIISREEPLRSNIGDLLLGDLKFSRFCISRDLIMDDKNKLKDDAYGVLINEATKNYLTCLDGFPLSLEENDSIKDMDYSYDNGNKIIQRYLIYVKPGFKNSSNLNHSIKNEVDEKTKEEINKNIDELIKYYKDYDPERLIELKFNENTDYDEEENIKELRINFFEQLLDKMIDVNSMEFDAKYEDPDKLVNLQKEIEEYINPKFYL